MLEQSKKLSTAEDYLRYNQEVARQFGEMCSIMKGMTGKLPPIMREYCDFIFSVGEKTGLMAKLVSDYTQVILKGIDEAEAEFSKAFKSKSTTANAGALYEKSKYSGDLNKGLDALFR